MELLTSGALHASPIARGRKCVEALISPPNVNTLSRTEDFMVCSPLENLDSNSNLKAEVIPDSGLQSQHFESEEPSK
jgi:hypothetical protein